MKNLIEIRNAVSNSSFRNDCYRCNKTGFFCYTPQGADYHSCPLCGAYDYMHDTIDHSDSQEAKDLEAVYDADHANNVGVDMRVINFFCGNCRVFFDTGCVHACNGCTDNCYNGHLVGEWRYKSLSQVVYTGMPQFDSPNEWFECANDVEILKWVCPNRGMHCTHGSYPKSSHPHRYSQCDLVPEMDDA